VVTASSVGGWIENSQAQQRSHDSKIRHRPRCNHCATGYRIERPYGTAWLLQPTTELREWNDADAKRWLESLQPLESTAVCQYLDWPPNLVYPIRIGTHNQTAFAFALALDSARAANHDGLRNMLEENIRAFYFEDRQCPLNYEPSGEDFLSPCLAEADLVRRVMSGDDFAVWLTGFLPDIPSDGSANWLEPGRVFDPTDGKRCISTA
jgi:hypothetical protein